MPKCPKVKSLFVFFLVCNLLIDTYKNVVGIDGQKKVPDKGPVMLLYELFNDVHFDCSTVDGAQNNCRFKMIVNVNNNKFEGTGKHFSHLFMLPTTTLSHSTVRHYYLFLFSKVPLRNWPRMLRQRRPWPPSVIYPTVR